jgi:hypothetical protein
MKKVIHPQPLLTVTPVINDDDDHLVANGNLRNFVGDGISAE